MLIIFDCHAKKCVVLEINGNNINKLSAAMDTFSLEEVLSPQNPLFTGRLLHFEVYRAFVDIITEKKKYILYGFPFSRLVYP